MKGSVIGMPKLQLLRDFFCELEGPYTVLKLTAEAAKERVGRLELLSCGDRFGYFSALVEYFVASAKVVECRQYQNDVELVRYAVRVYLTQHREWSDRHQLVVKYNGTGELLAYSFDPAERYPMEIKADICEGDPDNPRKMHYPEQTVRWEDVLDFAWGEKDGGGVFVFEDGGNGSYISCWEVGEEDQECFSIEWCPYLIGRLRMVATTKSRGEMVDFLRKYMRGGLAEAQQCFTWRLSCDRLGAIEFVDEVTADLMRAKRKGQKEILESFPLLEIVRIDSCSMYYDNKNEKEIVRLIKKALKNGSLPDSENPMSIRLLVIFYLAVRGDRDSCKKLASLFWKRKNKQLCNYWRKCAGLAELKPRTPRPRKREPSNQLQFDFDASAGSTQ